MPYSQSLFIEGWEDLALRVYLIKEQGMNIISQIAGPSMRPWNLLIFWWCYLASLLSCLTLLDVSIFIYKTYVLGKITSFLRWSSTLVWWDHLSSVSRNNNKIIMVKLQRFRNNLQFFLKNQISVFNFLILKICVFWDIKDKSHLKLAHKKLEHCHWPDIFFISQKSISLKISSFHNTTLSPALHCITSQVA